MISGVRVITVAPTTMHKFLGVVIDQELRFREHANYVLAKGTKLVRQYRRLTKPGKGVVGVSDDFVGTPMK